MIQFSSSLKLNKIVIVDTPFNKDPKTITFFQGGPNVGRGMVKKFREMANNKDIYSYANRRVVNFEREYQPLPSGTKILVMPQFSYMPDQILGKKGKNSILPSQSIRTYSNIFYMTKRFWL